MRRITSFETARISVNGDIGYVFGGVFNELAYNGALTVTAVPRLTVIAEILGLTGLQSASGGS